jgi:peptidoglycan/LPS O-acetylase OafA/YrhL
MNECKGRVHLMDAGRGLAALLVLEHHVMVYFGERVADVLGRDTIALRSLQFLSGLNGAAVQFFFFLSGWAIYVALGQARANDGSIDWRVFAWHRCRRILPLYWLALLTSWALFESAGGWADAAVPANLAGNLAFLQTPMVSRGWFLPYAGNGPLWSLAYEAWYYAATPVLCLSVFSGGALRLKQPLILLVIATAVSILAVGINKLVFLPPAVYATMWPLWVAGFVFGMVQGSLRREGVLLVLAASDCLAIHALHALAGSGTLGALANGFGIVSLAIAIIMITSRATVTSAFTATISERLLKIFVFVGSGSYALYVLHYPVLRSLSACRANGYWVILSVAALVVATPYLERRLQRFVKNLPCPQLQLRPWRKHGNPI